VDAVAVRCGRGRVSLWRPRPPSSTPLNVSRILLAWLSSLTLSPPGRAVCRGRTPPSGRHRPSTAVSVRLLPLLQLTIRPSFVLRFTLLFLPIHYSSCPSLPECSRKCTRGPRRRYRTPTRRPIAHGSGFFPRDTCGLLSTRFTFPVLSCLEDVHE